MNYQNYKEQGTALLYIFWICLLLSAVLSFFIHSSNLRKALVVSFEQEKSLKQAAEDLTELAIAQIQNNTTGYDATGNLVITSERITELLSVKHQAIVKIRDEGSSFNPNNLPVSYWQEYLKNSPQSFEQLYSWCFSSESKSQLSTPIRSNYLLTPEDLQQVFEEKEYNYRPSSELTVFGPANYYLIDGEVFVSLLFRAGLKLSSVAIEAIIERFNDNHNQIYNDNLSTLLSYLQLPELPPLEKLEQLITTKGSINPNFVTPEYLRLLVPGGKGRDFSDLTLIQKEWPFTSLSALEDYLCNKHGIQISSERIQHIFSLQSKVFGIQVLIYNQNNPDATLELNTIIQRGSEEKEDSFQVIYRREKWSSGKKGKND